MYTERVSEEEKKKKRKNGNHKFVMMKTTFHPAEIIADWQRSNEIN